MTNGRTCVVALFVAATLLMRPTTVEGQRVAVSYVTGVFTATPSNPLTEVINLGTGVVESLEPLAASGTPVFTSDGRFLLLRFVDNSSLSRLELRDLVTGARTSLDLNFSPRHAHPRRLAVYGFTLAGVARLDATGLRPYTSCAGSAPTGGLELTVDGSRLLVFCQSGNIESIDEATGVRLAVVAAGTTAASRGFAINAAGSQALVARVVPGVLNELVLFDVATGTEILATPMPGPPPPAQYSGPGFGRIVSVTPSRDAVVVTNRWNNPRLPGLATNYYRTQILELATLAPRRQLAVPYDPDEIAISPDGTRAFVGSSNPRGLARLQDLDLDTGQETGGVSDATTSALGAAFVPLPPTLQTSVNGQRVTLSWNLAAHSPAAQRFVIHAGSRSGASDLGTIEVGGDVTFFSVAAVPPGRYFVRMTAVNFTGTSSPSTELIVDVPGQ